MNKLIISLCFMLVALPSFADYWDSRVNNEIQMAQGSTYKLIERATNQMPSITCKNCTTADQYMWAGMTKLKALNPGDFIQVWNATKTAFHIVTIYDVPRNDNLTIQASIGIPRTPINIGTSLTLMDTTRTRIVVGTAAKNLIDRTMGKAQFNLYYPVGIKGLIVEPFLPVHFWGGGTSGGGGATGYAAPPMNAPRAYGSSYMAMTYSFNPFGNFFNFGFVNY